MMGPVERLAFPLDDAATMLGVSKSSVYRLIGSGQLASVKVMGRRLITKAEINRVLGG